jgi:mannose-6-phosphate isomerase-like protein (cupin superfamily)
MAEWRQPFSELWDKLETSGEARLAVALRHGSMRALLYAPKGADPQTPHRQDEIYIVQSGTGTFTKGAEQFQFGPGDVIFVEAGAAHHFSFFSDDFAAWAIFWGPEGGE